jgi:soluble lytic murein transglycosylase-like protein
MSKPMQARRPTFAMLALLLSAGFGKAAAQPIYASPPDSNGIPRYSNEPRHVGDRLVMRSAPARLPPRIEPTLAAKPMPSMYSTTLLRRGRGAETTMSVVTWRRNPRTDAVAPPAAAPAADAVQAAPVESADRPSAPPAGMPIDAAIRSAARKFSVDEALVRAVIHVESRFDPKAVSPKGATGLMQLMPGTARRFGVADARDPAQNIHGGTNYLRVLLDLFNGDLRLALAAYNAGEGAVLKHKRRIPPYQETQQYVQLVLGRYRQLVGEQKTACVGCAANGTGQRLGSL